MKPKNKNEDTLVFKRKTQWSMQQNSGHCVWPLFFNKVGKTNWFSTQLAKQIQCWVNWIATQKKDEHQPLTHPVYKI